MKHEEGCVELYDELGGICICDRLRKAYREGYSDHARTVQHWQDTHGAYRQQSPAPACPWCAPGGES